VQIFPATQAEVRGLYIRCLWLWGQIVTISKVLKNAKGVRVVTWFLARILFRQQRFGFPRGKPFRGDKRCVSNKQKTQWWPSQSREESILKCLLIGNRGFSYKTVSRIFRANLKRVNQNRRENKCGNENKYRQPVWSDLLSWRKDRLFKKTLSLQKWKIL